MLGRTWLAKDAFFALLLGTSITENTYVEFTALARICAHQCQDQQSRQSPPSVDRIRDLASVRSVEGIPAGRISNINRHRGLDRARLS